MTLLDLPKAELHCHLDGIISPALARTILAEHPDFPIDPDRLAQAYPVYDMDTFFKWWAYIRSLDRNLTYYGWIIEHYMAQLKAQGVTYAEIMVANGEIPDDPAAALDVMQQFREWVNQCEAGQIQVEFIHAIGRSQTAERFTSMEPKILALAQAGLTVGVALVGPEINNPVQRFAASFDRFHAAGINIEIHAGEWVGAESVWDALEYGHPTRIGHGVALFDDPRLIALFQERQIHIEFCPTSNLLTGSVPNLAAHPVQRARELGLNFSISTDDPGIFDCTMLSEYEVLTREFGFTDADWRTIYHNSLASRFQPTLRHKNSAESKAENQDNH